MEKLLNLVDKNNIVSSGPGNQLNCGKVAQSGLKPTLYLDTGISGLISSKQILSMPFLEQPLGFKFNRAIKRVADLFFSIIFIAGIFIWLAPILAILIKLNSKGPVFFLQKRNKKNGKIFNCIKFRSMIVNEEANVAQAKENDVRITGVGKFIRKNHLDELPQFINVLLGDMSVIGPRPHMISDNLKYGELIANYSFRSNVKPGITGLA